MTYSKTQWENGVPPALNAANLNKIEQGIFDNEAALANKAAASHSHAPTDLTSAVPVNKGGTGSTTASGACANLGAVSIDLLWTNASPASVFSAQTISLNLSNYQMVAIKFRSQITQNTFGMALGVKDGQATNMLFWGGDYNVGIQMVFRSFTATATGVSFTNGAFKQLLNDETYSDSPNFAIPIKIYGIKGVQ